MFEPIDGPIAAAAFGHGLAIFQVGEVTLIELDDRSLYNQFVSSKHHWIGTAGAPIAAGVSPGLVPPTEHWRLSLGGGWTHASRWGAQTGCTDTPCSGWLMEEETGRHWKLSRGVNT